MKLDTEEIRITDGTIFKYMGVRYDCGLAIKKDVALILNEAETSHKEDLERLYNKDQIKPEKARIFISNGTPVFAMLLYVILYKEGDNGRYCCGNYYPIYEEVLTPHTFQASVCW